MKKFFLILLLLFPVWVFSIANPQPVLAVECASFLGTDPPLPKAGEGITLRFSRSDPLQTYEISVEGRFFTLGGNQTQITVGSFSLGKEYTLKIRPITLPRSDVCAEKWFKVMAANAQCSNTRVGEGVTSCGECNPGFSNRCCQRNPQGGSPAYFCYESTAEPPTNKPFEPLYCDPETKTEIDTGLGCVPVKNTTDFVAWLLKFALGIGGGIAFLLMIYGVFRIITSTGNPDSLKAGKETITSAVIGLLMIVFSIFLLQLIGVEILKIPGLGG